MRLALVVQTTSGQGSTWCGRHLQIYQRPKTPLGCSSAGLSNRSVERASQARKGVRHLSFAERARSQPRKSGARMKLYIEERSPSSSETRAAAAHRNNFPAERQGIRAVASSNVLSRPRRYRDSANRHGNASCSPAPLRCCVGNSSSVRTTSSLTT